MSLDLKVQFHLSLEGKRGTLELSFLLQEKLALVQQADLAKAASQKLKDVSLPKEVTKQIFCCLNLDFHFKRFVAINLLQMYIFG